MHDLRAERPEYGDRAVAMVAARQRGVVTRAQLAAAGLGRGAVAHRVAEGRLHRVHRGVYLVGHSVPAPLALETAALLACGENTFLRRRSAAALWRMPVAAPQRIEVTRVGQTRPNRPGIDTVCVASLAPQDRRSRFGLAVTSPARTLLDLGSVLTPRGLEQAVADALARRLTAKADLHAVLARAPRRHGAKALRPCSEAKPSPP